MILSYIIIYIINIIIIYIKEFRETIFPLDPQNDKKSG